MNEGLGSAQSGLFGNRYQSFVDHSVKATMQPDRQPAIPESQERLLKAIDELQELVSHLEEKLQPVLRLEPCPAQGEKAQVAPACRSVADKINLATQRVIGQSQRVTEIVHLLEL